jgi:cytosine/adenosine deaminase-related metal-dependent hydrolase
MSSVWLQADRIHNGMQFLPADTVIELSASGVIQGLHPMSQIPATVHVQYYEGILCPGFINAHCHVELSHMKGLLPEGEGLIAFLNGVMKNRHQGSEIQKTEARSAAVAYMESQGIVAVGDIANSTDTCDVRLNSSLHWHTLVEAIGFNPSRANDSYQYAVHVYEQFNQQQQANKLLLQSIVPHAPYSVSSTLLQHIGDSPLGSTLSIHNQETVDENAYFINKSGGFTKFLKDIGIDDAHYQPSGKSSVQSYLPYMNQKKPIILVHNTFTSNADTTFLTQQVHPIYLCICARANWYIERTLPPIEEFINSALPICLGTDSLASNYTLSIWDEIVFLQQQIPSLPLETILQWACYNGALALGLQNVVGTLAPNLQPGINWINPQLQLQKIV